MSAAPRLQPRLRRAPASVRARFRARTPRAAPCGSPPPWVQLPSSQSGQRAPRPPRRWCCRSGSFRRYRTPPATSKARSDSPRSSPPSRAGRDTEGLRPLKWPPSGYKGRSRGGPSCPRPCPAPRAWSRRYTCWRGGTGRTARLRRPRCGTRSCTPPPWRARRRRPPSVPRPRARRRSYFRRRRRNICASSRACGAPGFPACWQDRR